MQPVDSGGPGVGDANDELQKVTKRDPAFLPAGFRESVSNAVNIAILLPFLGVVLSMICGLYTVYQFVIGGNPDVYLVVNIIALLLMLAYIIGGVCALVESANMLSGNEFPVSIARIIFFHLIPFYNLYWVCKWPTYFDRFINERMKDGDDSSTYIGLMILSIITMKVAPDISMLVRFGVMLMIGIRIAAFADAALEQLGLEPRRKMYFTRIKFYRSATPVMIAFGVLIGIANVVIFSQEVGNQVENRYVEEALACYKRGNYKCTVSKATNGLRVDPSNGDLYAIRGVALCELDDDKLAKQDLDAAIKIGTDSDTVYYYRAIIAIKESEPEEAKELLSEAIGLNPKEAEYYLMMALLLRNEGEYKEALPYLDKTLGIEPDNHTASMAKRSINLYTSGTLEEKLELLQGGGIEVNPFVKNSILFHFFSRDDYEEPGYEKLFMALGATESDAPFRYLSKNLTVFETDRIYGDGAYASIARRMAEMTGGDVEITNVKDRVDPERGLAWLFFGHNGKPVRIELEYDDWNMDLDVFDVFVDMLEESGSEKTYFFFNTNENILLIGCMPLESLEHLDSQLAPVTRLCHECPEPE